MPGNISELVGYVEKRFAAELSDAFAYHNFEHTIRVHAAALEFGRAAGVDAESLCALEAAALLHDMGYTAGCAAGHEERGAQLALQLLPEMGWSRNFAETVARLIMATRFPCSPKSLLEGIMCDADIAYLGSCEAEAISACLREELARTGRLFTSDQWLAFELNFIRNVRFYSEAAQASRADAVKALQRELEQKLETSFIGEER